MTQHGNIPSPLATGGAGAAFEQQVGAMFLALLLVRLVPAVFRDCHVDEVRFQTHHLGWEPDDILVGCSSEHDERRLLAIQVKRNFAVRSSSSDCMQTFQRFWRDFKSVDLFDPDHDVLVLVTLPGTETLMDGLLMASISVLPNWPASMSHHGECDIDAERAGKTTGPKQFTGSSRLSRSDWRTMRCVAGRANVPTWSTFGSFIWPRQPWSRKWTGRSGDCLSRA